MLDLREKVTGSWLIALITILDAGKSKSNLSLILNMNADANVSCVNAANSCWFGYDQVSDRYLATNPKSF